MNPQPNEEWGKSEIYKVLQSHCVSAGADKRALPHFIRSLCSQAYEEGYNAGAKRQSWMKGEVERRAREEAIRAIIGEIWVKSCKQNVFYEGIGGKNLKKILDGILDDLKGKEKV